MQIQTLTNQEEVKQRIFGNCEWQTDLNDNLYTDVNAIILNQDEHHSIVQAQKAIVRVLHNTLDILRLQPDFNEWLGISHVLTQLAQKEINTLTTYGRFDWVITSTGELKVLEFNSETPMGWIEAIEYTKQLFPFHGDNILNVNDNLFKKLTESIQNTLTQYNNFGRVAIVGDLSDEEENDTFNMLQKATLNAGAEEVLICNIDELKIYKDVEGVTDGLYVDKNNMLFPIDILQSFYSIEWLAEDEGGADLLELIHNNEVKLMNPISTLQLHSKGLWALIWQLYNAKLYDGQDRQTIENYIPFSTFDIDVMAWYEIDDFVQKPLHHREGSGITFKHINDIEFDDECVFQEKIDIKTFQYEREKQGKRVQTQMFPTIGVYCINDEFGGYMTRLSETICSAYDSTFLPTFVEKRD